MDIKMPVMDGFGAMRQIRKLKPDIPIVAITAYSTEEDKQKCFSVGCSHYLTKPLKMEKLFVLIREIMSKTDRK